MKSGYSNIRLCAAILLVQAFFASAWAQDKALNVKPQTLIDQCKELKSDGSNDDAIAKAILSLKAKDASAKIEAAAALGDSCDRRATEPLIAILADQDPQARVAAIEALGKLGDPAAVVEFNIILDDKDPRVRLALVRALASFRISNARNLVVNGIANPSGKEITDPEDAFVRCTAILTIAELSDVSHSRKAILFLYYFLKSGRQPIRALAEQTMLELKNSRNGPSEFRAILKYSDDPELRRWSARWIGKLGIESAKDVLQEAAANDRDSSVRQAASEALKNWGKE